MEKCFNHYLPRFAVISKVRIKETCDSNQLRLDHIQVKQATQISILMHRYHLIMTGSTILSLNLKLKITCSRAENHSFAIFE